MSDSSAESAGPPPPAPRRRRVSIQSKLLLMMLVTSVVSAAVVGYIGFRSGRDSLETAAMDRLTSIRSAQKRTLQAQFDEMRDTMIVHTRGETVADALTAFTNGFAKLTTARITREQDAEIRRYYEHTIGEREEVETGSAVDITGLLPTSRAQKYLQLNYTITRSEPAAGIDDDDAGDGSAWSAANARYSDFFRTLVTRSSFEDALLLDTHGNVVYSAYKNVDLGTNVFSGPYQNSNLAAAYRATLNSRAVDYVGGADFAEYEPAGEPTAWVLAAVNRGSARLGVLALQFPIAKLNRLMTVAQKWTGAGLGQTGETILVGPDNLMRSDSRLFLEDPERYEREVVRAGTAPEVVEKAIRQGGTMLVQPIAEESTRLAAQGQTGNLITRDYLGNQTLQSYAPVTLRGLNWVIIAKIDTAEAFAPVAAFTKTLVLSTVAIIFVICLAAMALARIFVRPVRQLMAGARQVSAGDYDLNLPVLSHDELGDLTVAFNNMGHNLTAKEDLIRQQREENERLLRSVMPEAAAEHYRDGDDTTALEHSDLTVIAAEIDHLDAFSAQLDSDESLSVVNKLVRQFDAAAESLGVEPVQTLHDWYLAACGLSVPRLDSGRRAVDFAVELQHIVDRFNRENDTALRLRVGINSGPVTSGLIGRSGVAYDMWGSTVNLAYRLKNDMTGPGVYLTSAVHEVAGNDHEFVSAGTIIVNGVEQTVWRQVEHEP
ncbi:adenylate/guanylate cyclase domain-containing protein [Mycobacterium sp. 1274756.6]|uniref:adenylate/guanylate cyclase domain-containing protein n=1 Tax=Mycobacterium sp. 1274756.6 TaxID=1834076 RepID=UPI0007FC4777|nr:adenylate/guanylate cyclase domain-containing protein [Mycobacterium sp. 1274756.6]OBJ69932.1 cyclase [Mycobacterium sp. 1274756.6]